MRIIFGEKIIAGERLLLNAAERFMLSSDNTLDFHCEIWSLSAKFLKYRLNN